MCVLSALSRVWSVMGSNPTRGSSFFLALVYCVALPCCLYDPTCFILPSFLAYLINMCYR